MVWTAARRPPLTMGERSLDEAPVEPPSPSDALQTGALLARVRRGERAAGGAVRPLPAAHRGVRAGARAAGRGGGARRRRRRAGRLRQDLARARPLRVA